MSDKSATIAVNNTTSSNWTGRLFLCIFILAGLGVTLYREALYELSASVLNREESSHGLFVPFIAVYLLWLKFGAFKETKPQVALLPGGILIGVGFLLLPFGQGAAGFSLPFLSFLFVAGGLVLVFFGMEVFREAWFPILFLATMIPLPEAFYNQIAEWMRTSSTWGSVVLSKFLGVPLYREGFDIYLPNNHLYVAHSCSGIRYLLSYLTFSFAYAFRFKKSNSARLLVVLGAVPLSIAGGIVRLTIIFITAHYIGPIMLDRQPHVLLSWSVFTVLLVGFIAIDQHTTRTRSTIETQRVQG